MPTTYVNGQSPSAFLIADDVFATVQDGTSNIISVNFPQFQRPTSLHTALCSQERLTRGTVTSTMRKAAHPSGRARCWRWSFSNKIPISLTRACWVTCLLSWCWHWLFGNEIPISPTRACWVVCVLSCQRCSHLRLRSQTTGSACENSRTWSPTPPRGGSKRVVRLVLSSINSLVAGHGWGVAAENGHSMG